MKNSTIFDRLSNRGADPVANWLLERGLAGVPQQDILNGYCEKLTEAGLPLMRLHVAQRAFHPQYGGIGFDWYQNGGVSQEHYARSDSPVKWQVSPMYHLLETGRNEFRERLCEPDHDSRFPLLNELRQQGATDYLAAGLWFEEQKGGGVIDPDDPPEGMLISWTSNHADGFSEPDITLLRTTLPYLGLALKSASNRQMADDLLGVYLGRDAGHRVLSGEIQRGSLQQIDAVICYFDLTGFTRLAEQMPGAAVIDMLNDYFGLAVCAIQDNGGNVLKFMGDGLLALFEGAVPADTASAGLDAAAKLRHQIRDRNVQRRQQQLPTTGFTLALHAGTVLYGNIGAQNRLDFTAIGPAVNLAARLSGMHRSIGQDIIVSEPVFRAAQGCGHDLVSVGRYMLRGVSEPQELFTVHDPAYRAGG